MVYTWIRLKNRILRILIHKKQKKIKKNLKITKKKMLIEKMKKRLIKKEI